jgi:hypothetical protein
VAVSSSVGGDGTVPGKNAKPDEERDEDVFAVRVTATESESADLVGRGNLDYGDRPHFTKGEGGKGRLDLFVTRPEIEGLRADGFDVEVVSNQSARWRARLDEVGQGDRFEEGARRPTGLGRKIGGEQPRQPPPADTGSADAPREGT